MYSSDRTVGAKNLLFGWMGTVLLLGIIPIKLLRFEHHASMSLLIGVAPSVLGPAGLLFLLLSSTGWISRFSLLRVTLLVAILSVTLELMQLLPRPGILANVHYTFDYYDLAATALSVVIAYAISAGILRRSRPVNKR
ncbi:MAG: hypothetical protein PHD74_08035 [Candidatus Krumholzibacteria bacterium]|nr:hypothetical protein [Candidatus Krumholzibacteria bacterium]MDD5348469.1 hypothetical protein [Candidatus Omnitrophota bacterium]